MSPNVWDNFGRKFVANNFEKSPNVDTLWPNASESFSHVHVTQVVQLLIAALRACQLILPVTNVKKLPMIDDCKLHSKVLPCLVLLYLALLPILKEFSSLSNTSGVILVQSKSIYKSKRDSNPRPYDSGTNVVNYSTYFVYCSSQYVTRFSHSQLCQQSSRV